MTHRIAASILALFLSSSYALAMCGHDSAQIMSCAEGQIYDAASQSCVPNSTS